MQQAVKLGAPGQVIWNIVELGAPVKQLLRYLADRDVEPAYVYGLLAAFPTDAPDSGPTGPAPSASLVEPVSSAQMEVLVLLEQRLSNKEIAARLVISPLTVKRHMTNICRSSASTPAGLRSSGRAISVCSLPASLRFRPIPHPIRPLFATSGP